ncbi:hypothetical protein B0H14DRAFT_3506931 [Mycena olivaceomarginata]|nr:hypothetical protein B0H14DRAFT_3506931 [Mycena olivaceomarginata]
MDEFYPNELAAGVEEWSIALSQKDSPFTSHNLSFPAAALDASKITIKKIDGGRTAKAMFPGTGQHRQEAELTVVGVLKDMDLPPVKKTRYNTDSFQQSLDALKHVAYEMFSSFESGTIEPWIPDPKSETYGSSLTSNCRYFTLGKSVPQELKTPFDRHTDPHNVLSSFLTESVTHCFDNDVAYMDLKENKYVDKDPSTFQRGDIVEMGFAFVAWKIPRRQSGPSYTCKLVMRSLTFLDGKYSKQAYFQQGYKAGE